MRLAILLAAALALGACASAPPAASACAGMSRSELAALKAGGFEIADAAARQAFALSLTACLADPDPALRDGVGYEGLTRLMRGGGLDAQTMTAIAEDLAARLGGADANGFEQPFAALVLSEAVSADRARPYMTSALRARVLDAGVAYLAGVRDYRGYDEAEGWRHGVAHGADLMMQMALNDAYGRDELARIRDAVAAQIAPDGHFYIYGESARLAAPILIIARRGVFSAEEWRTWFETAVMAPAPLASWDDAFGSQRGLAKRHDVAVFLYALTASAALSADENVRALLPGAEASLRALP